MYTFLHAFQVYRALHCLAANFQSKSDHDQIRKAKLDNRYSVKKKKYPMRPKQIITYRSKFKFLVPEPERP